MRFLVAAVPALLLAACATPQRAPCPDGERAAITETLYFGTARAAGGAVSEAEWEGFLREVVAPRQEAVLRTSAFGCSSL